MLKLECSRVLRSDDILDGAIVEMFSDESYSEFCVRLISEDATLFRYTTFANEAIDLYFHTTLHYATFEDYTPAFARVA